MSEGRVTPKFLTEQRARTAISRVLDITLRKGGYKRDVCHIVILVPSVKDDYAANYPGWPNYPLEATVLHEHTEGRGNEVPWKYPYDEIARCKALQLWTDRNDGRTDAQPHLLFPGDTPYWGGVKRQGIVVACSGVEPHFDKMMSGMIADMLIGLAYDAWTKSEDRKSERNFLS